MTVKALEESIRPASAFLPDDRSGTTDLYNDVETLASATGIDTRDYDEALIELSLNTIASTGTLDVTILESSVGTTAAGANAITGAAFSQKSNGDSGVYVGRIQVKNNKRYLYVKAEQAIATSKKYGVNVILGKSEKEPVTQANTAEFTVTY